MHANRILLAIVLLAWMIAPSAAEESKVKWIKRIDEARPVAAESKKDLLITFTGRGWCHYCELLDRAVFKQAEFALEAPKTFVLVEIDFAAEHDAPVGAADEQLRQLYAKWKKKYLIDGVPVVVLADAAGKPYAYLSYYNEITAEKFLETLSKAQAARAERDQNVSEARTATTDLARAVKLNLALQAINTWLGTREERGADPLLTHYADVVAEIQRLDADNAGGLRELYDRRIAARDAWVRSEEVFKELDKFKPTKDHSGAIAYLDKVLPTVQDAAMRWRLEHARQVYLEWDGRYESGLENARRLLQVEGISSEEHKWLLGREAFNLINSGRTDEYLEQWNRRFDRAADSRATRHKLLSERAHKLFKKADVKKSIVAARELRKSAELFSDDWQTATLLLAYELDRDGDHQSAIRLYRDLVAYFRLAGEGVSTYYLLSIAEAQCAEGQFDAAQHSLDRAEGASVESPAKGKSLEFQRKRMTVLHETIRRAAESKS